MIHRSQTGLHWIFGMLCCLFLAIGCKEEPVPTFYVHQEMLPYCWFPNGGYWVYTDLTTPGRTDSNYTVGEPSISIIPDMDNVGYKSESYGIEMHYFGQNAGLSLFAYGYGPELEYTYTVVREAIHVPDDSFGDPTFFWDDDLPDTLAENAYVTVSARYDSIQIQGSTYYDAIEVAASSGSGVELFQRTIWARGVGVVRRSMTDGSVWELLRYEVR